MSAGDEVTEKTDGADSDECESDDAVPDLTEDVKRAIKKLIRKEDHIKDTTSELKGARAAVRDCKERILEWMGGCGVKSIDAKHGNKLIRTEKTTLVRPTVEQQAKKLGELIQSGVTDSGVIMQELKECAGTRTDVKLHRRRPRKPSEKKKKGKKAEEHGKRCKRAREEEEACDEEEVEEEPGDVKEPSERKRVRFAA